MGTANIGRSTTGFPKATFIAVAIFALVGTANFAQAATPREEIQSSVEKVLAILKDPSLKPEGKRQERITQLRQVIFPKFDFNEMARRSLGADWQKRTPEQQKEFVKLFTDLIETSYVNNLDSYNGEKVAFTGDKQDGEYAQVDTKITSNKGDDSTVSYKLRQSDGSWKIYDVVIENISIVNNYRSQFNRVIARSSFDDLLRQMREKRFDAVASKSKS
jgi:phospholipid transport system substrate-binding protein